MDQQLLALLGNGPTSSAQIMQALGVSQPTVSRLLAHHAARIAVVGKARATRYALRRQIRELPDELPAFRVTPEGRSEEIGTLITAMDAYGWQDREPGRSRFFMGVPWFLADMRPQGFLGRGFPRQHAELSLPERLEDWSDEQALYAMARRSEDLVGNLILGEESLARWVDTGREIDPVSPKDRRTLYPVLAQAALGGALPGSSAAGEQPKFLTAVGTADAPDHVLVKFTPPVEQPDGVRWADLLCCEALALETLRDAEFPAAQAEVIDAGKRRFLEVRRFDRTGARGRRGVISLASLDDEFVGERRNWHASAIALHRQQLISSFDVSRIGFLQAFGAMIGNSDMHFGNLSFHHEGASLLELAPAYDMLPMMYAPAGNEVPAPRFTAPPPPPRALEEAREAQAAAVRFWQAAAADERISAPFRRLCGKNGEAVAALQW